MTPTPVMSRAILVHNRERGERLADGIVLTPSHNPPEDGGFKYNPTHGGPADIVVTRWIENGANDMLRTGNVQVKRVGFRRSPQRRHDAAGRFCPALRHRSAQRCRYGGHSRHRPQARRRPPRWRRRALLGTDQRDLQAGSS
ncbi:MAG: hypothetical protein ACLP8B_03475, partial [Xanthobacteraceae bacterium]